LKDKNKNQHLLKILKNCMQKKEKRKIPPLPPLPSSFKFQTLYFNSLPNALTID